MNNDNIKTCSKCKIEKSRSEFGKHSIMKDGLRTVCKECNNFASRKYASLNKDFVAKRSYQYRLKNKALIAERDRLYRKNNKEKIAAQRHEYYQKNSERIKRLSREWDLANSEHVAERRKDWEKKNLEKVKNYKRLWVEQNPEKVNDIAAKRRAKKLENGVFKIRKKFLRKLYSSPCVICGSTDSVEADHIIPIAKGGRHSEGNLQPMCKSCNGSKSSKFMFVFRRAWERENLAFVEGVK